LGVYLHPFFITPPPHRASPLSIKVERDITLKSLLNWLYSGRGVLSSSGVQATGCISSSFAKDSSWPDIHYFLFGYSATSKLAPIVSKAFNLQEEEMLGYYSQGDSEGNKESFNVIVTGARPFSRGYIQLASTNPRDDPPLIDSKYLEDERDLEVLLEGVKRIVEIMENSKAVGKDLGCVFTGEKLPG
jgi:choline dehydrogenase-like flavoprotein